MSGPPDPFDRIGGRVDLPLLATKLVIVIGVGTVGSQLAQELANSGVGRMLLIDHDRLEEANLIRHALPREYLGQNKAEALALYMKAQLPTFRPKALPRNIDNAMSDADLDLLLSDADLIIAATDDREAQRRVARRALALDIPAVFPALYGDSGGEVFVQASSRDPCFFCWDGWRPTDERLRGVEALNADTLAVLQLAVQLSLGVLDPRSEYARLTAALRGDPRPRQLFIQRPFAALEMAPQARLPNCPSCGVGPAPIRADAGVVLGRLENVAGRRQGEPQGRIRAVPIPAAQRDLSDAVLVVGVVAVIVAVIVAVVLLIALIHGSSREPSAGTTQPNTSPHQVPRESSKTVEELASQRIAQLAFKCIEPTFCHELPAGYHLPVFIDGFDDHLAAYLSAHRYTDLWVGNGPYFFNAAGDAVSTAKAIVRGVASDGEVVTVSSGLDYETGDGAGFAYISAEGSSGLMPDELGYGLLPQNAEPGGTVEVRWKLMDASGEVVRALRFAVRVGECSSACEQAAKDPPVSGRFSASYSAAEYTPPPLF